jgi:hypothetical protein
MYVLTFRKKGRITTTMAIPFVCKRQRFMREMELEGRKHTHTHPSQFPGQDHLMLSHITKKNRRSMILCRASTLPHTHNIIT